ncbi:Inner membrane protein YohD [Marinibacterium anthonyi]|nr:Inner membrane protein YohD [Marinibacterium anthonyi]
MISLDQIVQTLGLPGVVIGTAIEGEGVAFLSGVFAHRHLFHFEAAALAATLGAIITDNVTFALGRFGGRWGYVQKLLAHHKVAPVRDMVHRHQTKAILGFRFIYGLKTIAPLLIAATPVPWLRYSALDAIAVFVWAHLFVGLGFFVGTAIEQLFGKLRLELHAGLALLIFAVVAGVLWLVLGRRTRARNRAESTD